MVEIARQREREKEGTWLGTLAQRGTWGRTTVMDTRTNDSGVVPHTHTRTST